MPQKERWATRVGLVLAMAGNAVGLGNFLRFPAQAVKNGGGAFIIPYLVALVVMGLPLVWIEWSMGRYGGQRGHHSAPGVLDSLGKTPIWKYLGIFGLWTNLIVASYYVYIESWTLAYTIKSALGGFGAGEAGKYFDSLLGVEPFSILSYSAMGLGVFAVCIVVNVFILSRGLAKGIELVAKVAMPLLMLFAIVLAIRGLTLEKGVEGVKENPMVGLNFLWQPKLDSLANPTVWLAAAGQIFFTLSIGLGSILCYSSYLRAEDDVALTGSSAAWTNEFCEVILGGTILIPIAVAYMGLDGMTDKVGSSSGLGLAFVVFPDLLNKFGALAPALGFLWFGLLFFAAITSSLAMGQPIMAFLSDEFGFDKKKSAIAFGVLLSLLAIPVAIFHSSTFLDEFDFWAGTFFLVVFALIETVLFVWVFGIDAGWREINRGAEIKIPGFFYYIIKYVTPVFLAVILVASVFEPAAGWKVYLTAPFSKEKAPDWEWAGGSMVGKIMHKDLSPVPDTSPRPAAVIGQTVGNQMMAGMGGTPMGYAVQSAAAVESMNRENVVLPPTPLAVEFYEKQKTFRTIDRLVMLGVFLFFAVLIYIAWSRRRSEGRT